MDLLTAKGGIGQRLWLTGGSGMGMPRIPPLKEENYQQLWQLLRIQAADLPAACVSGDLYAAVCQSLCFKLLLLFLYTFNKIRIN